MNLINPVFKLKTLTKFALLANFQLRFCLELQIYNTCTLMEIDSNDVSMCSIVNGTPLKKRYFHSL